jgi:DNA repair protein RecO (recombination protein O)
VQTRHDEIVVLRRVEYGESDLIITALSREGGVISALARGARASKRRFGGLGLLSVATASLVKRPRRELWELSGVELRRMYGGLAADVAAMAHASYGTELVRELLLAEQPEPAIFDLLLELYETLHEVGPSPPALRAFELRLLDALGLAPVLTRCVRCDAELPMGGGEGARFFSALGGVACRGCAEGQAGGRPLDPAARALLVAAAALPLERAAQDLQGASGAIARQARDAMVGLVLAHVGKPLRSLEFIAALRGGKDATRGPKP